eukprot:gene11905-13871_t
MSTFLESYSRLTLNDPTYNTVKDVDTQMQEMKAGAESDSSVLESLLNMRRDLEISQSHSPLGEDLIRFETVLYQVLKEMLRHDELVCTPIDPLFTHPAVLKQMIENEAVHPYTDANGIFERVRPGRLCLVLFHPKLPKLPLITRDVYVERDVSFDDMMLSAEVVKGLRDGGFLKPSPIQMQTIPLGMSGKDIIAQAKSGTGKTIAFGVIALQHVLKQVRVPTTMPSNASLLDMDDDTYAETMSGVPRQPLVLVLAPTREIAVQIRDVITIVARHCKRIRAEAFIGGLREADDRTRLSGAQIIVGTPGRIRSLIESLILRTDTLRMLILDEADKLLDSSFAPTINWIFTAMPKDKQVLAFSATYPAALANLLNAYMRAAVPIRTCVESPSLEGVKQYIQRITPAASTSAAAATYESFKLKLASLGLLLGHTAFHQAIVFCGGRIRAEEVARSLARDGWPVRCIAGAMDQRERLSVMRDLKEFKLRVLVSTDLIARGIDIERVNLVVNIDMPSDFETYFHRIGRTGRFGTYGVAITYVSNEEEKMFLREIDQIHHVHLHLIVNNHTLINIHRHHLNNLNLDLNNLNSLNAMHIPINIHRHHLYTMTDLNTIKEEDFEYWVTEHLRMNGMYWGMATLYLLGSLDRLNRDDTIKWVLACQKPNGGFSGNVKHDEHLLSTLSAIQILILLDAIDQLDVESVVKYVAGLQQEDGSFFGDKWGEVDTRFTYCAVNCLSLLGCLDRIDREKAATYIHGCKNFDAGYGCIPGAESHAGQTFTCVGALAILGRLDLVDCDQLGWWLSERQLPNGGLNGRPEKTSDDNETGGIADKPGNVPDVFHTFFGVCGFSLMGHFNLELIDPAYALGTKHLLKLGLSLPWNKNL